MTTAVSERFLRIRELTLEHLEIDDEKLTDESLFVEEHEADSMALIDLLGAVEQEFTIVIDPNLLDRMVNLKAVYEVVSEVAGW
jgi:acyl carrier protein